MILFFCYCGPIKGQNDKSIKSNLSKINNTYIKTDEEWRKILSPEQFDVMRNKGTEVPYSGEYYLFNGNGIYVCAACSQELFESATKFDDATCGWPSFFNIIDSNKVIYIPEKIAGVGTEVLCTKCRGHLGHVFDDKNSFSGLRYCINSSSIEFRKNE